MDSSDALNPRVPSRDEVCVRASLICTWHAFFARFPRLRDIQKKAILPILDGESVVVKAPTASGKTEAIMAPVLERLLQKRRERLPSQSTASVQPGKSAVTWFDQIRAQQPTASGHSNDVVGPAVLLVAPTKALCNDLCRRLHEPVHALGLSIVVRTGDKPEFSVDSPPNVLITTPESLDSLMSRKPAAFRHIQALIIDEIHLVYASGRGDELQCLIARLRILNESPIQICASSATVPEIQRLAGDFLGDNARIIACDGGRRKIKPSFQLISEDPGVAVQETADLLEKMLLESKKRKIIVFCNARATVEKIVLALKARPRIASCVFAHHGSLSKEERLRTEQQFLRAQNAACVSTSTLELGIDIGDVDRIVLMGPPPDVPSLIQRIGRGNRTESIVHVTCLANCTFNVHRFLHLVECAQNEDLFPEPVAFRPNAIVQQALSVCLQNPQQWIGKNALYTRIAPAARRRYSEDDCGRILDQMVGAGWFRKVEKGRFVPEQKTLFLFSRGYMHSMIADRPETEVVDSVTGRKLGSVYLKQSSRQAIETGSGVSLTLAGNAHTVSFIKDQTIYVKRGDESPSVGFLALEPPRYSLGLARSFAAFMNIPQDAMYIRCVPADYSLEHDFDPKMGKRLTRDMAKAPENMVPGYEYCVLHFTGTIGGLLLQNFFEKNGYVLKKGSRTPFFMRLLVKPAINAMPDEEKLVSLFELNIRTHASAFARLMQTGPWFNFVPEDLAMQWLLDSIDIRAYAKSLANLPIIFI